MTDKYIVSKSEIEAAFKTVSQCKTADYCEGFNDALKAVLDNAQVLKSTEPLAEESFKNYVRHKPGCPKSIYGVSGSQSHFCTCGLDELYANPPASVPLEKYNKLLNALKEATEDIADWGSYASDFFQEKHNWAGDIAKYRAIIAEEAIDDAKGEL